MNNYDDVFEIETRPSDFDVWGILSNHKIIEMFELSRWNWGREYLVSYSEAKEKGLISVVSDMSVLFERTLNFNTGIKMDVTCSVHEIGLYSLTLEQSLKTKDIRVAKAYVRIVAIDKHSLKPVSVSSFVTKELINE